MESMKKRKVDIEVSTIIGIETKIANQVSSWRPAGITWVTLEPNTADDLAIEHKRDHWLVALQSISYRTNWTLPMTLKS